jgi:hypothetical protein
MCCGNDSPGGEGVMMKLYDKNNPANSRFIVLQGLLIFYLVFIIIYSFFDIGKTFASTVETIDGGTGSEVMMQTNPENGFISAANIAPGDVVKKPLEVMNRGKRKFVFNISAEKKTLGVDMLFNILELQIVHSTTGATIYDGKLNALTDVAMGQIDINNQAVYDFSIRFPEEAGNDYQGRTTSVAFLLTAAEAPAER